MLNVKKMLMKLVIKVLFVIEVKTGPSTTCAANSNTRIDFNIAKNGYNVLGIVGFDIKNGGLTVINYNPMDSASAVIWVKNQTSAAITVVPTLTILYQKQ